MATGRISLFSVLMDSDSVFLLRSVEFEGNDVYRGSCLHQENCRGGTEVSVKITCDTRRRKEDMFEKTLMWLLRKEDWSGQGVE